MLDFSAVDKARCEGLEEVMAFAIIRTGGKQFCVEAGATLRVPSLKEKVGDSVELEVLAHSVEKDTSIGAPTIARAKVMAKIVNHGRAPKIVVFKKKRRKHYKRTKGHRQAFTTLKIESIG
jgi:large subunit ribosomal protein L21